MIKLYQYPTDWNLPNISPFCMKLETYLRLVQIPYEIISVMDPRKSPKGKLPYIDDNGQIVADTSLAIEFLKNKYGDALDGHLSPIQKATALAIQRMVEEHLYWVIVYSRWIEPTGYEVIKPVFFGDLSQLLKVVVPELVRRQQIKVLYNQGLGRHTPEEIYKMGINDISAVATILGENRFMLGNDVTSIDATVYAFIANIVWTPIESPIKEHAKSLVNLMDYCDRMKEKFNAKV